MTYRRPYRFVYQTQIGRYERDALAKAAKTAVERALRPDRASDLGHAYRVDDAAYSVVVDADREEYGTSRQIEIAAFPVLKLTDTGFRIRIGGWDRDPETKWIAFGWTKHWADLTPEDALRSFIARRQRQAKIYEGRAQVARSLAADAECILGKAEALA